MESALVGKRHGGTRISGWGTGEARKRGEGRKFRWTSWSRRWAVKSKIAEDASPPPDLAFISVGPQAPYFQFVESLRIWSNVSRARGQNCDWILKLRAQALQGSRTGHDCGSILSQIL